MLFLKEFFSKVDFEKNQLTKKSMKNFPACKELKLASTVLPAKSDSDIMFCLYTEQKKLRKSQKSMQHQETIANNYSIFIYLFTYMSSVDKNDYLSLLAPIPLMWHSVK